MDILPTAMGLMDIAFDPRAARNLTPEILSKDAERRDFLLAEYHGLRYLYSQRILISDDNWKYIFSPGDYDELYNLNSDPCEMKNLASSDLLYAKKLNEMRNALIQETARFNDPLRDCVAKFNGQWRTGSTQFDATTVHLTTPKVQP
jgi:arylsulfatase A-like enzyme